jgi:hypothetical protein
MRCGVPSLRTGVLPIIRAIRASDVRSYRAIAGALNARAGHRTTAPCATRCAIPAQPQIAKRQPLGGGWAGARPS